MDWFNIYGLIFVATLLVPNIVYGALHRDVQPPKCGKVLEICEQIGRYGAMACMVFNIPYVVFGFWFAGGFAAYLFAGGALLFLYILLFALFWRKSHLAKALALSVLPMLLFLACGVLFLHIPLIVFAAIFGYAHITISCKNVKYI
mgnify:CR=1 FL=1